MPSVLLQVNYGGDLHVLGVLVGRMLQSTEEQENASEGSVMIIIATNAPLNDRNLSRLAKRAIPGIGRTGRVAELPNDNLTVVFSIHTFLDLYQFPHHCLGHILSTFTLLQIRQ